MNRCILFLKEKLNAVRAPKPERGKKTALTAAAVFLFGTVLGIFAKLLDTLELDSAVRWHRGVEALGLPGFFSDLAVWLLLALLIAVFSASALRAALKVFVFFVGMCAAYHLYTVLFAGFDPGTYMLLWYALTLASPVLAVLCWYAKGRGPAALLLDIGVISVMALSCFSLGWLYVGFRGALYVLVFAGAAAALYRSPKQALIALPAGFLLAFPLSRIWPFYL